MTTLTVPAADTHLHATDTPGPEPALLFIAGGFATQNRWKPVLKQLGGAHRTVTFDGRARGRSGTSADYSTDSAAEDVGRVIDAAGLERPVLVGWSHGATLAVRYAATHPGTVRGLVLIDGAYPVAMFGEADRDRVRAQFRKLGWIMRVMALLGRSARMSAAQSAEVVLDMDAVNGRLLPDFAALTVPAAFVVAGGAHSGAPADDNARMRAAAALATAANPQVRVFATCPHNHIQVISKDAATIAAAITDVLTR